MADYIYSIVLLLIALVAIELRKSYHQVPKAELRYRAREGDVLADKIYKAVAYEESLEILLWAIIILAVTGSLAVFNSIAPLWFDFIAVIIFLSIAFAWLPRVRVNSLSEKLVIYLTPALVWALSYLQPLLQKVHRSLGGSTKPMIHTGLYDKNDLLSLINNQKKQADNRIDPNDLSLLKKVLKFSDKTVSDYLRPWSKIHHTLANDSIGPVLLDEMHKSGQLFVPVVTDDESKKVVGMVDLSRLDLSTTGQVREIMSQNVYYLSEDETLVQALNAMTATGQPVFMVLDKKGRLQGMITLKDIISELTNLNNIDTGRDYSVIPTKEAINENEESDDVPDSLKTS